MYRTKKPRKKRLYLFVIAIFFVSSLSMACGMVAGSSPQNVCGNGHCPPLHNEPCPDCVSGGGKAQCEKDKHCPNGKSCQNGRCIEILSTGGGGKGQKCSSNSDCGKTQICQISAPSKLKFSCSQTQNSRRDEPKGNLVPCMPPLPQGICVEKSTRQFCDRDDDCDDGDTCIFPNKEVKCKPGQDPKCSSVIETRGICRNDDEVKSKTGGCRTKTEKDGSICQYCPNGETICTSKKPRQEP